MQQAGDYIRERELLDKRERERGKNSLSIEIRTGILRERKWIIYHSV